MKLLLHVGCGGQNIQSLPPYFQDGNWEEIRLDIDPDANPDIIADIRDLSILENNSFDAIYSSHNIEHIDSFEINSVLSHFNRILKTDGISIITCPDIESVAQEISNGKIIDTLYTSPAGPINSLDIIYGHQKSIQNGKFYMAHKTAFTKKTLAFSLINANFFTIYIARDVFFGLHSISFKTPPPQNCDKILNSIFPSSEMIIEHQIFKNY